MWRLLAALPLNRCVPCNRVLHRLVLYTVAGNKKFFIFFCFQSNDTRVECTSGTRVDCKHNQSDKKSDLGSRVIADSLALFCDSDADNSADEKSHEILF